MSSRRAEVLKWSGSLVAVVLTASWALTPSWRLEGMLTYDDNPFRYSRSDLDDFRHGREPARFPIRTSDDLDINLGTGLSCPLRLAGQAGAIEARTRLHWFSSNWEKSYALVTFGVEQGVWRGANLGVSYTAMPGYLLRHYRNPETSDTGDYAACRFAEHLAGLRFRQRFDRLTVVPHYGFEYDDYVAPFDHYDAGIHRVGGEVRLLPFRSLEIRAEYEYRLADARGPVPDASFIQHEAGASVVTRPRKLSSLSLESGYTFARRSYTTENPGEADPAHAGRVDNIEGVSVVLEYRLTDVTLKVDYELEWRSVVAAFSPEIDDIKDYRESRLGLGVKYSGGGKARKIR